MRKKNNNYFFSNTRYLVEFYFSLFLHWVRLGTYHFQEYFDYLEIMRFRLWNSIQADKNISASEAHINSNERYARKNTWVIRPVFTKIIDWFSNFSPIRGFGWDFGSNTQSIESDLRQREHAFGLENFYAYNRVQRQINTNHPKRFSLHYFHTQTSEDYQNVDYLPIQLLKNVRSVSYIIYSVIAIFFFSFFILIDTIYLINCWLIFKIFYNIRNNSHWVISIYIFGLIEIFFLFFKYLFKYFFKFLFFLVRPLLYFVYIWLVIFSSILIFIKSLVLIIYIIISKPLFNFFIFFYKKLLFFNKFRLSSRATSYTYMFFRWCLYLAIWVYLYPIEKWVKMCHYLSKNYKIIEFFLRFSINFFSLLIRSILFLTLSWYIWKPLVWFIHYFVYKVICLEYYSFFGPAIISVISILSLVCVIPYIRKFVKISRSIRLSDRELEYEDGKHLSSITIQFYKALSRNVRINKVLRKWPMGREVISVQMMNEEEITGRTSSQLFNREHIKKKFFEKEGYQLNSLIKYFSERLDITQSFNSVVNPITGKLDSDATIEDKKFFETAQRDTTFKFRSKEFKVTQFKLVKFYQYFSEWEEDDIASRSIYNYQFLYYSFAKVLAYKKKNFTGFSYDFFADYQSSFIFTNNLLNLQFLKISEFSKIFKGSKYFFQISAQFPTRNSQRHFEPLDWKKGEYLSKLESPISTNWNWENNLISQNQNWVCLLPANMRQNRGFENLEDFFWSKSVLDDKSFHSTVHAYRHIFLFNRSTYIKMSQRIQIAYDFYWSFRINTNVFLAYTFGTDFYFSSNYSIIPNWLFKNSLFTSIAYPTYQDNLATLFTHIWNLEPSTEITNSIAFSKILNILTTASNIDNGLKILHDFHNELQFRGSYIKPQRDETFPSDLISWRNNLSTEKSVRDKKAINDSVEHYLVNELNIIDPEIFSFSEAINQSHKRESAFVTYLSERTSDTISRYVLGEREKRMGIIADVYGIVKVFLSKSIPEDEQFTKVKNDLEYIKSIEHYDKKTSKQLLNVRITSRCFPVISPNILWHFYLIFVLVAYVHLLLLDDFFGSQNTRIYRTEEMYEFAFEFIAKMFGLLYNINFVTICSSSNWLGHQTFNLVIRVQSP